MTTATATTGPARDNTAFALRLFAWGIVFVTFAFLVENYLIHWLGLPGARGVFTGAGGYLAAGVYGLAGVLALAAARNPSPDGLRGDSARITANLRVPIYQGGRVSATVRQNKEILGQRRIEVDQSVDNVRAAVVSAYSQLEAAQSAAVATRTQRLRGVG